MSTTTHVRLAHPEDEYAVLGALDHYTSDLAREIHSDAYRLAAIDDIMAQHNEARAEAVSGS